MDNVLYGKLGNRILLCEAVSGLALGESFSDFPDLFLGQYSSVMINPTDVVSVFAILAAKDANGVKLVFAMGDDLKVLDPVIVLDSILVVQDQSIGDRANEQLVDKTVDLQSFDLRGSCSKGEDIVPILVYTASDDFPATAQQSTQAGDFVTIPLRDVRPFFDLFHTGEDTTGYSHTARPIIPH